MKMHYLLMVLFLSHLSLACGKHPGITHEEWTSSVKEEKRADGRTYETFSTGFFDSRGGSQDSKAPVEAPRDEEQGSRRPVSSDF